MILQKPRNQKAIFRQRGYFCPGCEETLHVFGNDVPSKVCPECGAGGELIKKWDHLVQAETIVSDYVEDQLPPEAPQPAPVEPPNPGSTVADPHDEPQPA